MQRETLRHRRHATPLLRRSESWYNLRKAVRSYMLGSQTNKQLTFFCVIGMFVWSFVSTILLILSYRSRNASCSLSNVLSEQPLILGEFHGPRWHNDALTVSKQVLIENKWLSLTQHTVQTHLGEVIDDWLWVDTNHQINVGVTTMIEGQEFFVIFEQTKYGYNGLGYATVGGHIDPEDGGDALKGAKRELLEEMGMVSQDWVKFGAFRTDVNRGLGFCHTFLARKAMIVNKKNSYSDETEQMSVKYVNIKQLMEYYQKGLFKEAKWSNTIGLSIVWMLSNADMKHKAE